MNLGLWLYIKICKTFKARNFFRVIFVTVLEETEFVLFSSIKYVIFRHLNILLTRSDRLTYLKNKYYIFLIAFIFLGMNLYANTAYQVRWSKIKRENVSVAIKKRSTVSTEAGDNGWLPRGECCFSYNSFPV